MEPPFMETVKTKIANAPEQASGLCRGRSRFAFCLVPFALCLAGCINTGSFLLPGTDKLNGGPCEVVVAWNPEVLSRPDPANRGAPTKGLGGRMYLFGEGNDCPLIGGDGCAIVDLYDETPPAGGNSEVPLEEWRIDSATLKRLLRRDAVGWGYTLFLPWGTYRPDISHIELRLRYEPAKGTPLYAENSSVVLQKVNVVASSVPSRPLKPGN
jgi:hypothetical protein